MPTRFRGEQKSCLDLIFTNEENMVEEIEELPPIGKSDHVCQKWELIVEEVIFKNTTILRRNYRRAEWNNIKNDIRNFKIKQDDSPDAMYDDFLTMLDNSKAENIPLCRPKLVKHRLP